MLNVVLIDDQPVVLAGLIGLLGGRKDLRIAATGATAEAARRLVQQHACDVLVVDMSARGDMLAALRHIRARHTETRIVVFTADNSVDTCMDAINAGANAYLLKDCAAEELFHAIDEVAAGREFVTSHMSAKVIRAMRSAEQRRTARAGLGLNAREGQVVRELLNGASNKEIASRLNLSDKTVKHYMTQIMQKFNVRNRLEVVLEVQRMNGGSPGLQA